MICSALARIGHSESDKATQLGDVFDAIRAMPRLTDWSVSVWSNHDHLGGPRQIEPASTWTQLPLPGRAEGEGCSPADLHRARRTAVAASVPVAVSAPGARTLPRPATPPTR